MSLRSENLTEHLMYRILPGCVRLWDVSKAADNPANGTVIAQTDSDIGHFSLGDPDKGERTLVV